ncbi:hypothetical protein ACFXTN_023143 [Malus domestica]
MHWTHNCESFFLWIFLYWKFERAVNSKLSIAQAA